MDVLGGDGKKGPGEKGPANCETHAIIQIFHIIRCFMEYTDTHWNFISILALCTKFFDGGERGRGVL